MFRGHFLVVTPFSCDCLPSIILGQFLLRVAMVVIMRLEMILPDQYVEEGWDWMTPIRDRNTGIWDEMSLSVTGPVKIIDLHLMSSYLDNYKKVYLYATMELEDRSGWGC